MAQNLGKRIAKVFSVLVAALFIFSAAFLFTACETDHPQIKMTVEFNKNTYELNYKLYRKMYPNTVAHYLELIEQEYYNDTAVHNYDSSKGFSGGAYTMVDADEYLVPVDYNAFVAAHPLKNITVWEDAEKSKPLNTLVGEFSQNGYDVANNGLSHTKGSLSTQYERNEDAREEVYTSLSSGSKHYKDNCVTSMFFISSSSNTSMDASYCTFGVLADSKSETRFQELIDAINEYISDHSENNDDFSFTEEFDETYHDDFLNEDVNVTYTRPTQENPIIIRKVEVVKY